MTAPKTCPECGAALDPGEVCTCRAEIEREMEEEWVKEVQARQEAETVEETGTMEFVMGTDLDKVLPASIDFNFEQLKVQLVQALDRYQGLVVTADDIKGAKSDRAKLNALRTALEDKRKEVKRRFMEPYSAFEARVKELVGLIDQPIAAIDGQLKTYEEQRRADKYAQAQAYYTEVAGDLLAVVPFGKVWRGAWGNASISLKAIKQEITSFVTKIRNDLATLETVESDFAEAVKLKYLETLDLSAALAERARLQEQAQKLREYEAEQRKREAIAKLQSAESHQEPQERPDEEGCVIHQEIAQAPQEAQPEKVYRLAFECYVTRKQVAAISDCLKANNITYRRI